MNILKYLVLSMMVVGMVALTGCGGSGSSSSSNTTGEEGIVQLGLTDAV